MKITLMALAILGLAIVFGAKTYAAPFKPNFKNPNVVAYYPTGLHGVPDEPGITHEGKDLVMAAGKSGNFQQWFYGTSDESNGKEGDHTVWRVSKDDTCANGWTLIPDAYPSWGTYLEPGADYCVKTNDFRVEK